MLDPEAAAAARLKRGRKKAEGRRRKMDDVKRKRSAQVCLLLPLLRPILSDGRCQAQARRIGDFFHQKG